MTRSNKWVNLTDGNDFAFPASFATGLTKREWLAGMALQGLLSADRPVSTEYVADKMAVVWADAVIFELNKDTK